MSFISEVGTSHNKVKVKVHVCMNLSVNDKVATMDMVICHNDLICHRVHRHEPPVTAQELTFIHKDEDLVVINKPASIPVSLCVQ